MRKFLLLRCLLVICAIMYYNILMVGPWATKAAVWVYSHAAFHFILYYSIGNHLFDADVAFAVREHPELAAKDLKVTERMPRFTAAFNRMFDGLTYSRIANQGRKKIILFRKNGTDIPIDALSSGEKQIVYRGCFLLKDVNAIRIFSISTLILRITPRFLKIRGVSMHYGVTN